MQGDVSVAFAALALKISYGGLMLDAVHQRYRLQRIDSFAIALVKTPGSKHWQDEEVAKKISYAYKVHLDVSRADTDDDADGENDAESDVE